MFCASIRRRRSFAAIASALGSQTGLNLRESSLETHDLEIGLHSTSTNPTTLRFLLLSPSCVATDALPQTLSRIQRFAALTGGENIAIIFLLSALNNEAACLSTAIAEPSAPRLEQPASGLHAYARLSSVLLADNAVPHVPILPLSNHEGLTPLVRKYINGLQAGAENRRSHQMSDRSTMDLLSMCSVTSPLRAEDVLYLSDLFPSLKDMAELATLNMANEGNPDVVMSDDFNFTTSKAVNGHEICRQRLASLAALRGEDIARSVVEFWQDEWVAD